ncbi:uncharacterized protein LOC110702316 [Chenopodium quinoa]|uniref:uncharacterized protein LOC110702316 n=1 Tax=Chenopodium quinoa TaxID=63459 RepID=UPI000B796709|nr:uncharacterized protein LOC110702316 [Chenopodium quinoa]
MSILSLERPIRKVDYFVYWKYTRDGFFATKSAYLQVLSNHFASPGALLSPTWWKRLWGLPILPKWKMLAWKTILHNALPAMDTLSRKGIQVDLTCVFCHTFDKSVAHLFQDCPFTGPLGVMWIGAIWLTRNNVRFRSAVYSPHSILDLASDWCRRSQSARNLKVSPMDKPTGFKCPQSTYVLCGALTVGCDYTMLFDGAWDKDSHKAGTGWCFHSASSPHSVGGGAKACVASSKLHSELLACLFGLQQARLRGFTRVLLTDCLIIPRLLLSQDPENISVIWIL